MNNQMKSNLSHLAQEKNLNYEEDMALVIADVQAALDAPDEEGDDCVDGDADASYPRTVTINFPEEAAVGWGAAGVEISVREILDWYATAHSRDARCLQAISGKFYSDPDEDYTEAVILEDKSGPHSPEERAEARIAYNLSSEDRQARWRRIRRNMEFDRVEEAAKWAPFVLERELLENERSEHAARAYDLDLKWGELVSDRVTIGEDDEVRARRADLEVEGDQLAADQDAWAKRWSELRMKVEDDWMKLRRKVA